VSTSGSAFYLSGRGLSTRVEGAVRLRSAGRGAVTAVGSIEAVEGTYEGFGQRLQIARGRLNFQGAPDNPGLDILALRTGLPVEVGVTITRTAAAPLVRMHSDPPMADAEALSWLVLGRPPDQAGSDNIALMTAAASLLAGGGEGYGTRVARAIGVDEISIRSGNFGIASLLPSRGVAGALRSDEASAATVAGEIITIGKNINESLTLSYQQAISDAGKFLQLNYRSVARPVGGGARRHRQRARTCLLDRLRLNAALGARRRRLLAALAAAPLAACGRKAPRYPTLAAGSIVLALGDSLTFGTGAAAEAAYPARLAALTGWTVVNAGVPGNTSAQARERLPHTARRARAKAGAAVDRRQRLPAPGAGGADANEHRRDAGEIRATGAQTVLIAVPRPAVMAALLGSLDDHPLYEALAAEHRVPLFASGWAKVLSDPRLKADRIHANAAGYERFARELHSFLREAGLAPR
jgi:acyl-CoA thioesterase I